MSTQVHVPSGFIHLGIGQPSHDLLPAHLFQAGMATTDNLAYGEQAGAQTMRDSLSIWLSHEYSVPVDPQHLMITNGSSNALDMICSEFTAKGDVVLVEDPTYFIARELFASHGLQVLSVPMNSEGVDIEALETLIKSHNPAFFYCIPAFQNPTSLCYSNKTRERLVALAKQYDCLVVADEVYQQLYFSDNKPSKPLAMVDAQAPVLSIGTFSKILAPGLRLGWLHSMHDALNRLINSALLKSGGGLAPMTSAWVKPLIDNGAFESHLQKLKIIYAQRCNVMCAAIKQHFPSSIVMNEPQGGYFIWVKLNLDTKDSERLENQMKTLRSEAQNAGVDFMPGSLFTDNPHMHDCIRLCFAFYKDEKLEEGIARLGTVIKTTL